MTTSRIAAAVCRVGLALAACGGEGDLAGSEGCRTVSGAAVDTSVKPEITIPKEEAPATLISCDVVEGDGPEAVAGQPVTVQYVGVSWSTGEEFDASWDRGQPFSFALGQGTVIQGWDQGVAGMKVGGRRELIIPPQLGYGEAGAGGIIAPNETLVFVVDLLAVGA